jgi:hypothetical protein
MLLVEAIGKCHLDMQPARWKKEPIKSLERVVIFSAEPKEISKAIDSELVANPSHHLLQPEFLLRIGGTVIQLFEPFDNETSIVLV